MVSVEQVMQALEQVMDPEIHRNIVELGMVREVKIQGAVVHITIALTVPNCPLQGTIAADVEHAVTGLDAGLKPQVTMTAMTPQEKERMVSKLRQGRKEPAHQSLAGQMNKVKSIIAVMSGKGGVGKSTTAALLAAGLRKQGLRVGILDADITGPSVPKLLGVNEVPVMGPLGIIPPLSSGGIKLMSINLLLQEQDEAVIWRGPLISGAIQQFWNDVFWGDLDVLLVDLPPGTSDAALTVMQSLPVSGVVIVTSPQDLADMVVRKAARMAEQLHVPIIGIVENMSYVICPHCGERHEIFGKGRAEEMALAFNTQFLGQMGLDSELTQLSDAGEIETYTNPDVARVVEQVRDALNA
ncbi:MAG: Mrp/NBP35 family ATP-binding protein [Anaerolineae bacterium]|nr:Mrp/NBP35 family ATP-binding protein [Anaerolineae bacterium]